MSRGPGQVSPRALAQKRRGLCLVTSDYGLGHVSHTRKWRQSHPGRGRDEWPHSNEMETSRRVAGRRSVADRPSPRGGNKKDRPAAGGRQGRNYTFTLPFSYCDGAHTSPLGPGRDTPANFQHELWDRETLRPGFLPGQHHPAQPNAGGAATREWDP